MQWMTDHTGMFDFISYWDFFQIGGSLLYCDVKDIIAEYDEIEGVIYLN